MNRLLAACLALSSLVVVPAYAQSNGRAQERVGTSTAIRQLGTKLGQPQAGRPYRYELRTFTQPQRSGRESSWTRVLEMPSIQITEFPQRRTTEISSGRPAELPNRKIVERPAVKIIEIPGRPLLDGRTERVAHRVLF